MCPLSVFMSVRKKPVKFIDEILAFRRDKRNNCP